MYEMRIDPFYTELKSYPRIGAEFHILKDGTAHAGEASHRSALAFVMEKLAREWEEDDGPPLRYDLAALSAVPVTAEELLHEPEEPVWITVGDVSFFRDEEYIRTQSGGNLALWYAVLEPPHHPGYTVRDFHYLMEKLFPGGTDGLEILRWNTDWSEYFDLGREGWGTGCWTVYDRPADRYIVILAAEGD